MNRLRYHSTIATLLIVALSGTLIVGAGLDVSLGRQLVQSLSSQRSGHLTGLADSTPSRGSTPRPTPAVPATPDLAVTPLASTRMDCRELLRDGGFEARDGWNVVSTAYTAAYIARPLAYVSNPVHSGRQALCLGIKEGADVLSHSAVEQWVDLPREATELGVSFWINATTSDGGDDAQYLLLLREEGGYDVLMWELVSTDGWQRREISLNAYRGRRVALHFGVYNDGDGALTSMHIDDVSVRACWAPS